MAYKQKPKQQSSSGSIAGSNVKHYSAKTVEQKDFFTSFDNFFDKRAKVFFIVSLFFTVLFSILLFDVKVSDGGDDSAYIVRAYDFIHDFSYPGFQGALYPMMLSVFIVIFGINLPVLKIVSLIFICIHIIMFYRTFKNNVPPSLLFPVMLLLSVNSSLLYFASQTYSEAFFICIQITLFFVFFKYFLTRQIADSNIKKDYKKYLLLGLMLFLAGLTKNIGYVSFIVIVIYFLIAKAWKQIVFSFGGLLVFLVPYEILKRIVWGGTGLQVQSQAAGLLYKDYYNPSKGLEDFSGFIGRFIDNSNLYLSKHLFAFAGFRDDVAEITPVLTILIYALFGLALYQTFKHSKPLLFTGIYTGIMCLVSFVALQKQWDQGRIVIVYFPFMLLFLFAGIYFLFKNNNLKKLQFLLPILMVIIFYTSLQATGPKVKEKKLILSENISGNLLYGLTPDWINFINMSKWVAKNIPVEDFVGSRKPDISFIYTNRKFFPMYKVPNQEADSLFKKIEKNHQTAYIIDFSEVSKNPQSLPLLNDLRKNIGAFVNFNKSEENNQKQQSFLYAFYMVSDSNKHVIEEKFNQFKIKYETDSKEFFAKIGTNIKNIVIYEPDVMLKHLEKYNVKYIIMASLRKNPRAKTGEIIDTINRYLYFIQMKYPNIFSEKYKIGDDETATLIEVHYDKKM